ncbi:MAG TPA: hypothetical protein GXZ21_11785 [Clostridiales bacterium]|nr:hypothetical protein [Clostridiales bacterium]
MIKRKILVLLMLITTLFAFNNITAYAAYNLEPYEWSDSAIKYYYDNYNSTRFKTYIGIAASTWNSESINASLSYQYPIGAYCTEVQDPNAAWDGICYISYDSNGYITNATLCLNASISVTWNNDNALKSVAVHEFGHILSLGDNGEMKCIMNDMTWGTNSRYGTYKLTTPQSIDVAGVNYIY